MTATENVKPTPHSTAELDHLVGLTASVPNFPKMNVAEQDNLLRSLESYECYSQVATLLNWRIDYAVSTDSHKFSDHIWVMRTHYLGHESFPKFIEAARKCVKLLKLPFALIRIHIAEEILGHDNFAEQAKFYLAVKEEFVNTSEKVLLLERLALIYEKKLFLEHEVEPLYKQILKLDHLNMKALRFYKLWYSLAGEWYSVAHHLEKLIEASSNLFEKQRAAHELAQLYLYNLNQAKEARDTLLEYCKNSQLDTRQTLIEVYERLESYNELLECLDEAEALTQDPLEKAEISLKKAQINLKTRNNDTAIAHMRRSIQVKPDFLLGYEMLVTSLLDSGKEEEAFAALHNLRQIVSLDSSKRTIDNFVEKYTVQ